MSSINNFDDLLSKRYKIAEEPSRKKLKLEEEVADLFDQNLDLLNERVNKSIASGNAEVQAFDKQKPVLKILLETGESVFLKGNPRFDRAEVETQVYHLSKIFFKSHMTVPVKKFIGYVDDFKSPLAMQVELPAPRFVNLYNIENLTSLNKEMTFSKLYEILFFEFIFGMSDCNSSNLMFDKQSKDILHFDNEYSFQNENFNSYFLLYFSEALRDLVPEEHEIMQKEIHLYKKQLQESSLDKSSKNYLFIEKRILALENSINLKVETLADVILDAHPEFKKAMFLKLAIAFLNIDNFLQMHDSEINQIIRNNLGSYNDSLPDDFMSLTEELQNYFEEKKEDFQEGDILDRLENEWLSLSIQEFKQTFLKWLAGKLSPLDTHPMLCMQLI